jgi:type VI secretion system protein ImpA
MFDAASGRPERNMGDSVVPAVEPDWERVIALATGLLSRSKDIRIANLLGQALLHTQGFSGLGAALTLTRGLLTDFWDSVHPRLDPDDDNDPTERMNALLSLCGRDTYLNPLRSTPLVRSRVFGAISLRDLEIAEGKITAPADPSKPAPPDKASINAAFQDCELEQLRDTAAAVAGALRDARAIEAFVTERVGAAQAPNLNPVVNLLAEADSVMAKQLATRSDTAGDEAPQETAQGVSRPIGAPAADANTASVAAKNPGEIASREDVMQTLDRLSDYFARYEPSSPVPLLLQRARRLVTKDFMDIVRDIAPGALDQVEAIRGPEDKK